MKQRTSALLVYGQAKPLQALHLVLEAQDIKINQAQSCEELRRTLARANPPHILFTDTTLPDGTWADVLAIAAGAPKAVNVIVVGRWADVQFYVEAIERGAFDFIVPPFEAVEIEHVVRCAVDDVMARREGGQCWSMRARTVSVSRPAQAALRKGEGEARG